MSGEHIDGLLVPENPGNANPFPHKDLSVKPPKVAAMSEGDQSGVNNGELGENSQARAADWKQEAGAA